MKRWMKKFLSGISSLALLATVIPAGPAVSAASPSVAPISLSKTAEPVNATPNQRTVKLNVRGSHVTDNPGADIVGVTDRSTGISQNSKLMDFPKTGVGYTVRYFKDGKSKPFATAGGTAVFGSRVKAVPDKTPAGYELDRSNLPFTVTADASRNIINVYYKKADIQYTVKYYKDNDTQPFDTETDRAPYQSKIFFVKNKAPAGYRLSGSNLPFTVTADSSQNIINVYYTKAEIAYIVNYYREGSPLPFRIEAGLAVYQSQITDVPDRTPAGYELGRSNLPFTITANPIKNIINVYYYKKTDVGYTVNYFKDGKSKPFATVDGTAALGSQITAVPDKTPAGYELKTSNLPFTVTADASRNIINVYYKKTGVGYTVNYFKDDETSPFDTEEGTAVFGSQIRAVPDKTPAGYELETSSLPFKVTADASRNIINVYYKRADVGYTVNYFKGDETSPFDTEEGTAAFGSQITDVPDKAPAGYELKTSNLPFTVTADADGNVINIYYAPKKASYVVHYVDKATGRTISADKTGGGLFGQPVTEKSIAINGYTAVGAENATITLAESGNEITFYYAAAVVIPDNTTPAAGTPQTGTTQTDTSQTVIVDDPVPLAQNPKTGDPTLPFAVMAAGLMGVCSTFAAGYLRRKKHRR